MSELTEWIDSYETVAKSKKRYAHFDLRTDIQKCKSYITDSHNIATHSFFPFIHYEKVWIKYHGKKSKKIKSRDICYASHKDRCIFQLYSHILNELYNQELINRQIESVPVAYRTNLHENNIQIAKRAFDFIKQSSPCYVVIGDFTGFFDNLDHVYLKRCWCNLLGTSYLPEDHYAIFKNITRYCKWELSDLCSLNGLEFNLRGIKELDSKKTVLSKAQYKKNRSHIIKNVNPYGIPQGSPISAVLANLYMIDVDTAVYKIVNQLGGVYFRYSDDFIIILPEKCDYSIVDTISKICKIFDITPGLTLEPSKTQYYKYINHQIINFGKKFDQNTDGNKQTIDFLGFSFDGRSVSIRQKTITKYYYRMYRKAKTITDNNGFTPDGKKISNKNLYKGYSSHCARHEGGNFLTYVQNAKKCFGSNERVDIVAKRHMSKIRKALKKND